MSRLQAELEEILKDKIVRSSPVSGGCIATARKIETSRAKVFFCKSNPQAKDAFIKEANGLALLAKSQTVQVPKVLHVCSKFLVTDWIEGGTSADYRRFGSQLAQLHKSSQCDSFGLNEDNYLGNSLQINKRRSKVWAHFYLEERLIYQFQMAKSYHTRKLKNQFLSLEKRLPKLVAEDEPPCLIHGDLWSGNFKVSSKNRIFIFDPAVYYADREAEFGMIKLFGGFPEDFYQGYQDTYPLQPNWEKRISLYKLYHLLNHLNLFGSGYLTDTATTLDQI